MQKKVHVIERKCKKYKRKRETTENAKKKCKSERASKQKKETKYRKCKRECESVKIAKNRNKV